MKSKLFYAALCALMICLVGCKKDEPQEPKDPATQEENNQKEDDKKQNGPKLNVYEIETGAAGGVYKIQLTSTSMWSALPDKNWVTVDPEMGNGNAIVNVRVQAGTEADTAKINFVNDEGERILLVYREKSEIQEPTISSTYVPAPISISATKKVFFSPGNLQYRASTNTWRFAEEQYSMKGENNNYTSDSYDGWIDLFGWGTGNNPTLMSSNPSDYQTFVDWGKNKICSDPAGTWYTLSTQEWCYIFFDRTNAINLFSLATVNDVHGLVILPDEWTIPSGLTFTSITGLGFYSTGTWFCSENYGSQDFKEDEYYVNVYTPSQWKQMEATGAVFLPAAGILGVEPGDDYIYNLNYCGYYWSRTIMTDDASHTFRFGNHSIELFDSGFVFTKRLSVRLVKDVK